MRRRQIIIMSLKYKLSDITSSVKDGWMICIIKAMIYWIRAYYEDKFWVRQLPFVSNLLDQSLL